MVSSKGFSTICITLDPMVIKSKYDITIPIAKCQVLAAKSVKYSLLKLFSNGVEIRVGKYFNAFERLFDSVDISRVLICIEISVVLLTNHSTYLTFVVNFSQKSFDSNQLEIADAYYL